MGANASKSADAPLHRLLREWRDTTRIALSVPAYVVMTNAVLDELARVRPQTADELLGIKGIGPTKVRQYADPLLEILAGPEPAARSPPADSVTMPDRDGPESAAGSMDVEETPGSAAHADPSMPSADVPQAPGEAPTADGEPRARLSRDR